MVCPEYRSVHSISIQSLGPLSIDEVELRGFMARWHIHPLHMRRQQEVHRLYLFAYGFSSFQPSNDIR